jgi:hypothetical protein
MMAITTVVNEGSSSFLTIAFFDKDGSELAPNSATYQVDDDESGTMMLAETVLPAGSSVEIEMTPVINAIVNDCKKTETRVVTIRASYGSEKMNEEYKYKVKNLRFIL